MSVDEEGAMVWTIAEARAKLSEVMRLAESDGPQRIGVRRQYVIMPEHVWDEAQESRRLMTARSPEAVRQSDGGAAVEHPPKVHLGQWMVENLRGLCDDLPLPPRGSDRPIPFDEYMDDGDDE